MEDIQKAGAIFSPEGVMMLSIFGIIDIIDFFIGSVLIMDILAVLVYSVWIYFRRQAIVAGEAGKRITEIRKEREEKRAERKGVKGGGTAPKKNMWLRRILFVLEWIPIIGMIPGWTLMVWSELKS